jgi:hypothetical protein
MSKRQVAKDKVWSRIIRRLNEGCWDSTLQKIEERYGRPLTIKLACLTWWDCQADKEEYDWSELYRYVSMYKRAIELEYKESNLFKALCEIGYPPELAHTRIQKPKNTNGKRRL